jgi:hypothetical protein
VESIASKYVLQTRGRRSGYDSLEEGVKRDRERQRETERDRERVTETERDRERDRERQRESKGGWGRSREESRGREVSREKEGAVKREGGVREKVRRPVILDKNWNDLCSVEPNVIVCPTPRRDGGIVKQTSSSILRRFTCRWAWAESRCDNTRQDRREDLRKQVWWERGSRERDERGDLMKAWLEVDVRIGSERFNSSQERQQRCNIAKISTNMNKNEPERNANIKRERRRER